MSINYVNGKPFAVEAMPVDHPKCCGECYLWCALSREPENRRDDVVHVDTRNHVGVTREKFIDMERVIRRWGVHPMTMDEFLTADHGVQSSMIYMALSMPGGIHECTFCNQRPKFEFVDGRAQTTTECPAEDGVIMINEVSFPSGKIVIDDDLRDVHRLDPVREESFASYNTSFGQAQVVAEYAKHNIAYGPVGNSCPSVYKVGDEYVIGRPGYDEELDELRENDWGDPLAGVITDLWAYSIMDFDDYMRRGGSLDMSWTREVIDIEPGRYRFEHHSGKRSFTDEGDEVIYATFRRVGDALPRENDGVQTTQ